MVVEDLEHIIPDRVKQLSGRKIYLVFGGTIVFLVVACLVLGAFVGVQHHGIIGKSSSDPSTPSKLLKELEKAGVCLDPGCLKAGSAMMESMDRSVDPCDDFFKYACGNWMKDAELPPDHPEVTVISRLRDDNEERLREVVGSPIRRRSTQSAERKLKEFLDTCFHEFGRIKEGGKKVVELILRGLGGWYALDPENWREDWDFQSALTYTLGELNTNILFRFNILYVYSIKRNGIWLAPDGLGMYWRDYLEEDTTGYQDAYQDYIRSVGTLLLRDANLTLDASQTAARVEQFVSDVYTTELQLAEHVQTAMNSGGYYRTRTTNISELASKFPTIPWGIVIRSLFEGTDIADDTVLHMRSWKYFKLVNEMLTNETESHVFSRMMNNYMVWRVADTYAFQLSWEYRAHYFRFQNALYGMTQFPPTWHQCLYTARYNLGSILASEYLRTHVGDENRNKANDIFKNLVNEGVSAVDDWDWMDNSTRPLAKQKLEAITSTIGFPEQYLNSSFLDQMYQPLVIDRSAGFFRNLLNVKRFQRAVRTLELDSGDSGYIWQWINSHGGFGERPWLFYQNNHILIPAGILQSPFHEIDRPGSFNYGSLASEMGAEILKTVGETGHYTWINGSYTDWWQGDTYDEFRKRRACFNSFFIGTKLGPYLVKGENKTVTVKREGTLTFNTIRSLGGLRLAYKAFKKLHQSSPEKIPVALNLNSDQVFFTSYAQTKCYRRHVEYAYSKAKRSFLPEELLLHGALRHMDEFTQAFNCPVGSRLHAVHNETCEVF